MARELEDIERPRAIRKVIPDEPSWPTKTQCECCKADVFVVTSQDGDDLIIDARPMALVVNDDLFGKRRVQRAEVRFEVLRRVGGHRLLDPELFWGWSGDDEDTCRRGLSQQPTWQWYAMRMSLADAHASRARVYSEHIYTCTAVSRHAVDSKLTNAAVTGEAAGSMALKRRKAIIRPTRDVGGSELPPANSASRVMLFRHADTDPLYGDDSFADLQDPF